jgi:hypothetical protein
MEPDTSRRGTWVIARCFGNEAKRLRVWEEFPDAVWLVSDENYRRLSSNFNGLWPVGFRRDAVFVDDPDWIHVWEPSTEEFWQGLMPFV